MPAEIGFWTMAAFVVYVYLGYPLLLALQPRRARRRSGAAPVATPPRVTLLISAFNEADCISEKLDNTLNLDYPRERLDVVVISDASDDGTDEIVQTYAERGIRLLRMPQRGGKTVGLNAAVASTTSDIVVFSDANALYGENAIQALTAPFDDPSVGAVVGESTYVEADSNSGRSESAYWRYEVWIKRMESDHGSVVGGDGAIYAVRRSLYEPMVADALSDFVNPLQVVRSGFRCVYAPNAVSYEAAAADFHREYRRKVRIVNRAWRALWSMRSLLNPFRYGSFALKLWSHKVLRWWIPAALIFVLYTNILLIGRHPVYSATLACQLAFYTLAGAGFGLRHRAVQPAIFRIPFYFCLVNVAACVGLIEAMSGKSYTTWATARVGESG